MHAVDGLRFPSLEKPNPADMMFLAEISLQLLLNRIHYPPNSSDGSSTRTPEDLLDVCDVVPVSTGPHSTRFGDLRCEPRILHSPPSVLVYQGCYFLSTHCIRHLFKVGRNGFSCNIRQMQNRSLWLSVFSLLLWESVEQIHTTRVQFSDKVCLLKSLLEAKSILTDTAASDPLWFFPSPLCLLRSANMCRTSPSFKTWPSQGWSHGHNPVRVSSARSKSLWLYRQRCVIDEDYNVMNTKSSQGSTSDPSLRFSHPLLLRLHGESSVHMSESLVRNNNITVNCMLIWFWWYRGYAICFWTYPLVLWQQQWYIDHAYWITAKNGPKQRLRCHHEVPKGYKTVACFSWLALGDMSRFP